MDQRYSKTMFHVPPEKIDFEGEIIIVAIFVLAQSQYRSDRAFDTSRRLVSGLTDLRYEVQTDISADMSVLGRGWLDKSVNRSVQSRWRLDQSERDTWHWRVSVRDPAISLDELVMKCLNYTTTYLWLYKEQASAGIGVFDFSVSYVEKYELIDVSMIDVVDTKQSLTDSVDGSLLASFQLYVLQTGQWLTRAYSSVGRPCKNNVECLNITVILKLLLFSEFCILLVTNLTIFFNSWIDKGSTLNRFKHHPTVFLSLRIIENIPTRAWEYTLSCHVMMKFDRSMIMEDYAKELLL
ncbi:hypothetical protein Tco_1517134 [Tanacetum coccineum]